YFNVSPGSTRLSLSTSLNNASVLVAVTVGAIRFAIAGLVANERFGVDAVDSFAEFFVCSALIWGFHNHPELRDSTEMAKPTAAKTLTIAINRGRDLTFLILEKLRLKRFR